MSAPSRGWTWWAWRALLLFVLFAIVRQLWVGSVLRMEIVLTEVSCEVHSEHMVATVAARPIIGPGFAVHLARLHEGRRFDLGQVGSMIELNSRQYSVGGATWWVIFAVVLPGVMAVGLLLLIERWCRRVHTHRTRRTMMRQRA